MSTGRIFLSKNASCSGVGLSLNPAAAPLATGVSAGCAFPGSGSARNSSSERKPSLLVSSFSKSCRPRSGLSLSLPFFATRPRNTSRLSSPSLFLSPRLNATPDDQPSAVRGELVECDGSGEQDEGGGPAWHGEVTVRVVARMLSIKPQSDCGMSNPHRFFPTSTA